MHTGSELLETWIPDGGFMTAKRKLKTGDGVSAAVECLVAKWPNDELARRSHSTRPLRRAQLWPLVPSWHRRSQR
jgi:hypothetical protein